MPGFKNTSGIRKDFTGRHSACSHKAILKYRTSYQNGICWHMFPRDRFRRGYNVEQPIADHGSDVIEIRLKWLQIFFENRFPASNQSNSC